VARFFGNATANTNSDVSTAVAAANGLASPGTGTTQTVTLDLGIGTFSPKTVNLQPGIQLVIVANAAGSTLDHWTVNSGDVVLQGPVQTAGITVNGGTVTLPDGTVLLP